MKSNVKDITKYFSIIKDPRADNKQHLLNDIFIITILAVISGCEGWKEIEIYGNCKIRFLETILKLPNGIPSHDTFERIFKRISSEEFEKGFIDWISSICKRKENDLISIDGKVLRGSYDKNSSKAAIHMVSAWSSENQVVLGQFKVCAKSNEITAIPKLLDLLDISKSIITIDAMGYQKSIAIKIVENEADYILALKGNQGALKEEVENIFNHRPVASTAKTVEKDHGRIETRECFVINDMEWLFEKEDWTNLQSIIKIKSKREIKGKIENEIRYYISSLKENAKFINSAVRKHWGVENSLHWVLDVQFGEDDSRKRIGNSAENFTIVRRIALNILKQERYSQLSIRNKQRKASLDDNYLISLFK
ncbi:MAG: ISAs1 family transposase [archaeon]|nr:ISAs1 family transposase [archaeon]